MAPAEFLGFLEAGLEKLGLDSSIYAAFVEGILVRTTAREPPRDRGRASVPAPPTIFIK